LCILFVAFQTHLDLLPQEPPPSLLPRANLSRVPRLGTGQFARWATLAPARPPAPPSPSSPPGIQYLVTPHITRCVACTRANTAHGTKASAAFRWRSERGPCPRGTSPQRGTTRWRWRRTCARSRAAAGTNPSAGPMPVRRDRPQTVSAPCRTCRSVPASDEEERKARTTRARAPCRKPRPPSRRCTQPRLLEGGGCVQWAAGRQA